MKPFVFVDWDAIADCANRRALSLTFNFDDLSEQSPLGDLETREMALLMKYRKNLLVNIYMSILAEMEETESKDLL